MNRIHLLFDYIDQKYHLNDIPYKVAGKHFPRAGEEMISNVNVRYRFHGNGCSIYWGDENEILFSDDTTSIHQILVSRGDVLVFCRTYFKGRGPNSFFDCIDNWMLEMEKKVCL
ncbi:DUF6896 domain-containing protein [Flavihumibacter petaseus]|uniref:DUF6896 domain-containing protein n=1 Tax=Flavihumibacter petaseus TaxID=549295 RepID=UPI00061CEDF2